MNNYCDHLQVPVPDIEALLERKGDQCVSFARLMVAVLLEMGGPAELSEIAGRLRRAGATSPTGNLEMTLRKAWRGRDPVVREPDGRYALNLSSQELPLLAKMLANKPELPPAPAAYEPPGDEVPLTVEEVNGAFRGASLSYGFSMLRQAAAVLDAFAERMTLAEVEDILNGMTEARIGITPDTVDRWQSELVRMDEHGSLVLNRDCPDLYAMRRAVRKKALPALRNEARGKAMENRLAAYRVSHLVEEFEDQEQARRARRAVLRVLPDAAEPQALCVLDLRTREIRTFLGAEVGKAREAIGTYDLLAGLDIRETLHALGMDVDRFHLVDLNPPQKTKKLSRRGEKLAITPELVITSTTRFSRPLANPAKVSEYFEASAAAKLQRRIESDVKSLAALYQYGILHRAVRLRWGFLDEYLFVDWALPGDPHVREVIDELGESRQPVEIVVGTAPGFEDPWSRARLCQLLGRDHHDLSVLGPDGEETIFIGDIQAIRPVPETEDFGTRPGFPRCLPD